MDKLKAWVVAVPIKNEVGTFRKKSEILKFDFFGVEPVSLIH
jgi:hypothetical protein